MILKTFDPATGGSRITDMSNLYRGSGSAAFLVGGAPSLLEQNPSLLERRGIVTFAINNSGLAFKPTFDVFTDDPRCISRRILADPSIIKMASIGHAKDRIRPDDPSDIRLLCECPAVFFFSAMDDEFENEPGKSVLDPFKDVVWERNTLMTSLCIVVAMGFRRIYLCGSDFYAGKPGERSYSGRDERLEEYQLNWNENLYRSQVVRLLDMRKSMEDRGISLVDTSLHSKIAGMNGFEWMPLAEAVEREEVRDVPERHLPHSSELYGKEERRQYSMVGVEVDPRKTLNRVRDPKAPAARVIRPKYPLDTPRLVLAGMSGNKKKTPSIATDNHRRG